MGPNAGGAIAGLGNMLTGSGKKDQPNFSGGIIGRLGAVEKLERRAAKGRSTLKGDMNLARIAGMNAPPRQPGNRLPATRNPITGRFMANPANRFGVQNALTQSIMDKTAVGTALTSAERAILTVEGVSGIKSKNFMKNMYSTGMGEGFRTHFGAEKVIGGHTMMATDYQEKLIKGLSSYFETQPGVVRAPGSRLPAQRGPGGRFISNPGNNRASLMALEAVDKGIIKTLGIKGTSKAISMGGSRVALGAAAEIAKKAVPGLNLLFAADMAYQLSKLAGKGIAAGINFGKDGMKSMQGNMYNGILNAGSYKDDEVRATSRARGVAAIQNSRLNARSLLGSEGAMMAAHFG